MTGKRVYYSLAIDASSPNVEIWLADDCGHFVQKEVGALRTSLLPGQYVVSFGLKAPTYSIRLDGSIRLKQNELETGPTCPRPIPQFPRE